MKSRFTAAGILASDKSLCGFRRRRLVRSVGASLAPTEEILQWAANVLRLRATGRQGGTNQRPDFSEEAPRRPAARPGSAPAHCDIGHRAHRADRLRRFRPSSLTATGPPWHCAIGHACSNPTTRTPIPPPVSLTALNTEQLITERGRFHHLLPPAQVTMHEPGIIAPPPLPHNNCEHVATCHFGSGGDPNDRELLGQGACYIFHLPLLMLLMSGQFDRP
jgi:hypothetical protein